MTGLIRGDTPTRDMDALPIVPSRDAHCENRWPVAVESLDGRVDKSNVIDGMEEAVERNCAKGRRRDVKHAGSVRLKLLQSLCGFQHARHSIRLLWTFLAMAKPLFPITRILRHQFSLSHSDIDSHTAIV